MKDILEQLEARRDQARLGGGCAVLMRSIPKAN